MEAQLAHVNACRAEDTNLLQQADHEVFALKCQLQGMNNEKDQLQEKYKQKFKSLKYKKHPYLWYQKIFWWYLNDIFKISRYLDDFLMMLEW